MAEHIFGTLEEHPHIKAVGFGLRHTALNTAKSILDAANSPATVKQEGHGASLPDPEVLAGLLRKSARPVELITMAGYLGSGEDDGWLRLYPDETLNRFYILRKADIVRCERRDNEDAAEGKIDIVWLSRDADIARGRRQPRPNPEEAKFIEGGFLAAGDVAGALNTDSRRGTSGMFCAANSPGCCRRPSSNFPR